MIPNTMLNQRFLGLFFFFNSIQNNMSFELFDTNLRFKDLKSFKSNLMKIKKKKNLEFFFYKSANL